MTGRTRKLGLAGIVTGGCLLFGVGFAGAQAPMTPNPPNAVHSVSSGADSSGTDSPTGHSSCGDQGEYTTGVNPADL